MVSVLYGELFFILGIICMVGVLGSQETSWDDYDEGILC